MTNLELTDGRATTIIDALVGLGFEQDQTDTSKIYWSNDSNNKLYFKITESGTTTYVGMYTSDNTLKNQWIANNSYTTATKITYEINGNGILFGAGPISTSANRIHFIISAPVSQEDDWIYWVATSSNSPIVVNGRTEATTSYSLSRVYSGTALGVQLVKAYTGSRFADNIYLMTAGIQVGNLNQVNENNFIEATVGNDEYIVVNGTNGSLYVCAAVKRIISN